MNVLFVAYYFPPESSSGSFRPLYFANHIKKLGCQVSILTSKEEFYLDEQPKDYTLINKLDPNVRVIRTRVVRPREALIALKTNLSSLLKLTTSNVSCNSVYAGSVGGKRSTFQSLKDFITGLLAIPDPHIGWLPWAVWHGNILTKSHKIDVVWATGSPWTCFLVGVLLKKLTGKPLVLDYRDPWGSNPNMQIKNKCFIAWERKLEKIIVGESDLITANTKELCDDFLIRFPFLKKKKVIVIPNGFEHFIEAVPCNNGALTLTHAGSLYFSRNPINLLLAVNELLNECSIPERKIKIKFVGGISIDDDKLNNLLASFESRGIVEVYPRMSLDKVIKHQVDSDVLFLIQPEFPLQVPRKLYEYISLRKPILAITDLKGATARIVQENNFGVVVQNTQHDIKQSLKKIWLQWEKGCLPQPSRENSQLYLNSNISKILYSHLIALPSGEQDDAAS